MLHNEGGPLSLIHQAPSSFPQISVGDVVACRPGDVDRGGDDCVWLALVTQIFLEKGKKLYVRNVAYHIPLACGYSTCFTSCLWARSRGSVIDLSAPLL